MPGATTEVPYSGRLSLTIDGKPETYDLADEGDRGRVIRYLQKARAADKRFSEADGLRKQAEAITELLKSPGDLFKHPEYGEPVLRAAEEYFMEQIKIAQMPEADRRTEEYKRRVKELEDQKAQSDNRLKAEQIEREAQAWRQKFDAEFPVAMEKHGLPRKPEMIKAIAQKMIEARKLGISLTADDAAAEVRENLEQMFQAYSPSADPASLLKLIGEDAAAKIRAHDLARVKSDGSPPGTQPEHSGGDKPRSKGKGSLEWREELAKRFG